MFTGIVSAIGTIIESDQRGDLRLVIACDYDVQTVAMGASISCSGCCLTVVDKGTSSDGRNWFAVDASAETINKTASEMWTAGRNVNLERALKVGDELGGHIVTGHVDGVGQIVSIDSVGDSHRVEIRAPAALAAFIAAKGSIAVDGVSLTVNAVSDENDGSARFAINIIPHTWDVTTLGHWAVGNPVNLEIDTLARYLKRMEDVRS
jgi:riboflavin synthase